MLRKIPDKDLKVVRKALDVLGPSKTRKILGHSHPWNLVVSGKTRVPTWRRIKGNIQALEEEINSQTSEERNASTRAITIPKEMLHRLQEEVEKTSMLKLSQKLGVDSGTVFRVLTTHTCSKRTLQRIKEYFGSPDGPQMRSLDKIASDLERVAKMVKNAIEILDQRKDDLQEFYRKIVIHTSRVAELRRDLTNSLYK